MYELYLGDSKHILKENFKTDNVIDSIVCDPPYHIDSIVKRFGKTNSSASKDIGGVFERSSKNFMHQTWDDGDVAFDLDFWREIYRVLKPGGHVIAFCSPQKYHKLASAIEKVGFEIRDQLLWIYGTGFPKSHDVYKQYQKSPSKEEYDGIEAEKKLKGWKTSLKPAHEPIVLARKPINGASIFDNMLKFGPGALNVEESRTANNTFPCNVIVEDMLSEQIEWSKYFYVPKPSKKEKGEYNIHPTVKPIKLMQYLCNLITPKDGLILDPFNGSGTTAIAALKDGFRYIGIDMSQEYINITHKRIKENVEGYEE